MSFSVADEEKLINLVAKYSVIYDGGHDDYRNTLVKDNTWKIIGKELNKDDESCKKKWKFIRDSYNRFKKKHKLGSGAPKNSKDHRHQQLQFLDGVSQHRSGDSNMPGPPQSDNEENANTGLCHEEEASVMEFTDMVLPSGPIDETLNSVDKITETRTDYLKEQMETQSKGKRLKRQNEHDLFKLWKKRDEKRVSLMKSIMEKKTDDDVDLFCRHIAVVLRKLPPVQKAEAKKHLSLVLSDYEIMAARNLHGSSDCNASTSSEIIYDLPGKSSNESQKPNLSYSPVHYMSNSTSASAEPIELKFQANEEIQEFLNQ